MKKIISINIDEDLLKESKKFAQKNDESLSSLIRKSLKLCIGLGGSHE